MRHAAFFLTLLCHGGAGMLLARQAIANPIVPVDDGTGTIVTPNGNQSIITGGTRAGQNLFHHFQTFGVAAGQTANFLSNPEIVNIFSRVSGGQASLINGRLAVTGSNANLFLINPSGIVFGKNAQLNLPGAFSATTANGIEFGNQGWLKAAGPNAYGALTGSPTGYGWLNGTPGAVVNAGNLQVQPGQQVTLAGGAVVNTGKIEVPGGNVTIVAVPGEQVVRLKQDNQVLNLDLPLAAKTELASHPIAPPQTLPELLTGGEIASATDITVNPQGEIQLTATQTPIAAKQGDVIVAGQVSVAASNATPAQVIITGERVELREANVDASGKTGAGTIKVGGDFQGKGTTPRSRQTVVDVKSQLKADAIEQGNGGKIIVWSDGQTQFAGEATAQGKGSNGDGGLVETSGKQSLDVTGARVNASASAGKSGEWLLDPSNILIANGGTGLLTGGTFDPATTGAASVIAPGTIAAALNSGTNVTITTAGGTGGNGDITLNSSINQTGGGNAVLTLTGRRFNRAGEAIINLNSTGGLIFNINAVNPESNAPAASIQNAIDAIGTVAGDRQINLGAGVYGGTAGFSLLNVNKNVAISGANDSSGAIRSFINGGGTTRPFFIAPNRRVSLRNLVIQNGFTPIGESGGAILNEGQLLMDRVAIQNNRAGLDGGGIDSSAPTSRLVMTNTTITNNRAGVDGGGLFLNGNTEFYNGGIANNQAGNNGGGIYNQGRLTIRGAGIDDNTAGNGGGIYNDGSTAISDLQDFALQRNIATTGAGGGIFNDRGTLILNRGALARNQALNGNGGGITTRDGVLTGQAFNLDGNQAGFGGGLEAVRGRLDLIGVDMVNNQARGAGGGAEMTSVSQANFLGVNVLNNQAVNGGGIGSYQSTLNITGGNFVNNVATSHGGGLEGFESRLILDGVSFRDNQAEDGGAISNRSESVTPIGETILNNVTINNNQASQRGGAIHHNVPRLNLDRSILEGNQANAGGGIFLQSGALTVSNGRIDNNRSNTFGGAISGDPAQSIQVDGVLFRGNSAGIGGGAIFAPTTTVLSINQSTFANNQADATSGGAILSTGNSTIRNSDFFNNRSAERGGGIFTTNFFGFGDLTIQGGIFRDNYAGGNGGGLFTEGNLQVTNAQFLNNQSDQQGGGLSLSRVANARIQQTLIQGNQAADAGGGIALLRTTNLSLDRVTLDQNRAIRGGALDASRLNNYAGTIDITNSTISNNQATGNGGGIDVDPAVLSQVNISGSTLVGNRADNVGGGITLGPNANFAINNSTLTQNQAGDRGGAIASFGAASLDHVTVANNSAANIGGGLFSNSIDSIALRNALVALNNANSGADVAGGFNDRGNNLISIVDGSTGFGASTLLGTAANPIDPLLAPLADYGGLTQTRALLPGSRAIDAGNSAIVADQRGISRVNTPDIGAFESRGFTITAINGNGQTTLVDSPFAAPLQLTIASSFGEPVAGGQVRFAAPVTGASATFPIAAQLNATIMANGTVQVSPIANSLPGSYNITADSNGVGWAGFTLTNQLIPPPIPTPIPPPTPIPDLTPISPPASGPETSPTLPNVERYELRRPAKGGPDSLVQSDLDSLEVIDQSFTNDYGELGLKSAKINQAQFQSLLSELEQNQGIRSAVIYAVFVPQVLTQLPTNQASISPNFLRATEKRADDRLELLLLTAEGKLMRRSTPYRRQQINETMANFWLVNNDVENPESFQQFSEIFYKWLFQSVKRDLELAKVNSLIYVLDEGLRTLPLSSMKTAERSVLEDYTIAVIPSLGILDKRKTVLKNQSVLGMGASMFEKLAPLPGVPGELNLLKQQGFAGLTLLNEQFTVDNFIVQNQQRRPGIIHLATHANFRPGSPQDSYIQFWNQPLRLNQLGQLNLDKSMVELMVLSACNTATGDSTAELGFTGIASLLGVRTAIGSVWSISDVGTFAFMSEFYGQLATNPSRANALRKTQLAMQQKQVRIEQGQLVTTRGRFPLPQGLKQQADTTFSHPYFWSGFTMVGNPW